MEYEINRRNSIRKLKSECKTGTIDTVQSLLNLYHFYYTNDEYEAAFCFACMGGNLPVCKLLTNKLSNITFEGYSALRYAAKHNHVHILEWFESVESELFIYNASCNPFQEAFSNGSFEACKWLMNKFPLLDIHSNNNFIFKHNNATLEMIEWLLPFISEENINKAKYDLLMSSCHNGTLDIFQLLHDSTTFNPIEVFTETCVAGHVEMIDWIKNNISNIDIDNMDINIVENIPYGNTNMSMWFIKNYPQFDNQEFCEIVCCQSSDLPLFKQLFSLHTDMDYQCIFNHACTNNNLHICKFLYDNYTIESTYDNLFDACMDGHFELAKWLYDNNTIDITIDNDDLFCTACYNGRIEVCKFLIDKIKDIHVNDEYCFRYACANGHFELVIWLLDICPEIDIHSMDDYAFRKSLKHEFLSISYWLLIRGLDFYKAIRYNNDEIFGHYCTIGDLNLIHMLKKLIPNVYKYQYEDINNKLSNIIGLISA